MIALFEGVLDDPKTRKYLQIFVALGVLTVVEIGVVFLPASKILVGALLTLLASTKAALVGYHYMHLNHETKWLRFVALLPLTAVMYAAVLMLEVRARPLSPYFPENPRVFEQHEGGEPMNITETASEAKKTETPGAHAAGAAQGTPAPDAKSAPKKVEGGDDFH